MLIYYLAIGNGYLYAPKITLGKVMEIWKLPAQYVVAVSGGVSNPIKGYKLYIGNQTTLLDKEDVFHMKMFNPRFLDGNFVYGLSPISVAADIINNLNAGEKRMAAMLEKGIPPFIISAMSSDGLTEQQQQALEKTYDAKFGSTSNPAKPLMSGVQLKVDKLGFSAADLSIIENSVHGQRVLCSIYGVPSILLNDLEQSTYSNYDTALKSFYRDTVIPINDEFAKKLTVFLFGLDSPYELKFDYSTVPVLSVDRADLMLKYNSIKFMTTNEIRQIFGLEELNDPTADELPGTTNLLNEPGTTSI
jgi:HK97 family phage portal protein